MPARFYSKHFGTARTWAERFIARYDLHVHGCPANDVDTSRPAA